MEIKDRSKEIYAERRNLINLLKNSLLSQSEMSMYHSVISIGNVELL